MATVLQLAPTQRGGAWALAAFVADVTVPTAARDVARNAFLDTVGVALAGTVEPAARIVQRLVAAEGGAPQCAVWGTAQRTSAAAAALANGTAAHALDYDDISFVSLAHPSAPLVAAALAAGEMVGASGQAVLDGYVVGFEVEGVLGRALNPAHYQRGWHCTSTLGTVGAAAAVARILGLDVETTLHALAIAASTAAGLKENFGTMVKPLHAGMAARNAVQAALLAQSGFTAAEQAIDGPQGMLTAMDGTRQDLEGLTAALGQRWEILETGIAVKLYPSCAATHPPLDALLELRRHHGFSADDVERVDIAVDAITPTVLIYDHPSSGLEGKFSLQFCAAAAMVDGVVAVDTFDAEHLTDPRIAAIAARVTMRVDPSLRADAPALTQACVTVHLRDGRALSQAADGARGYPEHPASTAELEEKFRACASRALPLTGVEAALSTLRNLGDVPNVGHVTRLLVTA